MSHYIRGCRNLPFEIERKNVKAMLWLERTLRVYQGAIAGAWQRGRDSWNYRFREHYTSAVCGWILKSWKREGQDATLKKFKLGLALHQPPKPGKRPKVMASPLMHKLVPKNILYSRDAFIQFALIDRALPTAVGHRTMQNALSEHQSVYTSKHHPPMA